MANQGNGSAAAGTLVSGSIDSSVIKDSYEEMLALVQNYSNIVSTAQRLSQAVQNDWSGDGAKKFESWFEIIMSKLNDYTDMLEEMYDALVDSYVAYSEADTTLNNEFSSAINSN